MCLLTLLLVPVHTAAGGSIRCSSAELPSFFTKSSAQWPSLVFQPLLLTGNGENLPWSWIFLSSFSICLDKCGITICNAHQCCLWNSISFTLLQENLWSASQKGQTPTTYNDNCEKISLLWKLCELKIHSSTPVVNNQSTSEIWSAFLFLNAQSMFSGSAMLLLRVCQPQLVQSKTPLYFQWMDICNLWPTAFSKYPGEICYKGTLKIMSLAFECDMCLHHVCWNFECVQCIV